MGGGGGGGGMDDTLFINDFEYLRLAHAYSKSSV